MNINRKRVAIFSETNDPEKLEERINNFMISYDNNPLEYIEIIETKHHTSNNKWQEHTITVMITYRIYEESK